MNKTDIVALIKEEVTNKGNHPEYDADLSKLKAAGFKVETEEEEGGEGEGEDYHVVLKITGEDRKEIFVKCDGYYASYDGTDWTMGDTYEVKPKEVKVRSWATVK